MKTHLVYLSLLAVLFIGLMAPLAKACDGYGYGYGCDLGYLYNSLDYRVPYFAAHPPVYYSDVVPRTYGYSPFAYPPHVMTPDVVGDVEPVTIMNPYVPSADETKAEPQDDRAAALKAQPEPLVILNPYVSANRSMARTER